MGEGEGGGGCPDDVPLTSLLSLRGERRHWVSRKEV